MKIKLNGYARVTTAARVDVIGQVTELSGSLPGDRAVVRVPGWQADGYHLDWRVRVEELEPSTAWACREALAHRGW